MPVQQQPQTAVFHRSLTKEYNTASGGDGVYIVHPDGTKTLDGSSGAAVSCLGHGHAAVIEAIVEQAKKMAFAHTSFFTSDPAEQLAALLTEQSDGAFSNVMFLNSGKKHPPPEIPELLTLSQARKRSNRPSS